MVLMGVLATNLSDRNWGSRSQLALRFSNRAGQRWSRPYLLESENSEEFSYPAVIALTDGSFAMTYTWKRRGICFVHSAPREFDIGS